jgi:hypothetical protein
VRKIGTKEWALAISDALAEAGQTHTITVGVHDGYMPRERYSVSITPALMFSATDITALQRLAESLSCGIAYVQGSFTFGAPGEEG